MSNAYPQRRRRGAGLLVGSLIVIVLLVVAVVAAEFFLRDRIESEIADSATTSIGSPTEASLDGLAIMTAIDRTADGVTLTSDGGTTDSGDPAPALDIQLSDVDTGDDGATAKTLSGTATLSSDAMLAVATESQGDDLLSQLASVKSITPNPEAGALDVEIGDFATAQLIPEVSDGSLSLKPQNAEVMGMQLPENLLGGTISLVQETVDRLPEGVTVSGAKVTEDGLVIELQGENVSLG